MDPKTPGRPQTLPTADNPMSAFILAYYAAHGELLPIKTIADNLNVVPETISAWRAGRRNMRGPALLALAALRKRYGLPLAP